MEKTSTLVNTIFSTTKDYLAIKTKSIKLEIYENLANVSSSALNAVITSVIGLFAFMFLNIGVAYWLSEVLESTKLGFLTLGGFYIIVLGVYLMVKEQVAAKVKNAMIVKVSKETMRDYKEMVKEKEMIDLELKLAETAVVQNIHEAKENLNILVEDIKRLKRDFNKLKSNFVNDDSEENHTSTGQDGDPANKRVGPKIPRIAITSILDLLLTKVLFKKAGLIKRLVVPVITNALVTSTVFKEDKKTSLIENLKLKFAKFL
jgi:hypothetical protein